MNSLYLRTGHKGGYKVSYMTDSYETYNEMKNFCNKLMDRKLEPEEKLFTARDVLRKMIETGQEDARFKLGDIIMYSPDDMYKILTGTYEPKKFGSRK